MEKDTKDCGGGGGCKLEAGGVAAVLERDRSKLETGVLRIMNEPIQKNNSIFQFWLI